jgi:hypothetical protein
LIPIRKIFAPVTYLNKKTKKEQKNMRYETIIAQRKWFVKMFENIHVSERNE